MIGTRVMFSVACWYLLFYYIPELVLLIIGIVGASGFCLREVVYWGCSEAERIKLAIDEHTAAESSEDSQDSSLGKLIILNDAIGPRTITAKQRRLGVR